MFLFFLFIISNYVLTQEESKEIIQIEDEESIEEVEEIDILQNINFETGNVFP